jgi:hypothetical protein
LAAVFCRLVLGSPQLEDGAMALASFTIWLYLSFFCLAFHLTGPFVVMAFKMMSSDIPAFLVVILVFMGAFASALYMLSHKVGMDMLVFSFQSCLNTILDDFDADQFGDSFFIWPRVAQLVITFYLLIVTLVLMNMLIAKMGDTYNRISEIAELEWLLQRARVVNSIENEMSDEQMAVIRNAHWVLNRDGEHCFQIEEVDWEYWKSPRTNRT